MRSLPIYVGGKWGYGRKERENEKGCYLLGEIGLAFKANYEFLPSSFSIAVEASGGRLRCLLEPRITLVRSLAQRSYRRSKSFFKLTSELSGGRSSFLGNNNYKIFKITALFKIPVRAAPLYVSRQRRSNVGTSHVLG